MKEVLHKLVELHDREHPKNADFDGTIHMNTHGIEQVVLQFERAKYQRQPLNGPRLLTRVRKKSDMCQFCRTPLAPQGKWKHEKFCPKRPKKGGHA